MPQILTRQFIDLKVYQDIVSQESVIQNQIQIEVFIIEGEPPLLSFKQEAFAHFKQKVLKLIQNTRIQITLMIAVFIIKPSKFQKVRRFQYIFRSVWPRPLRSHDHDLVFIPTQRILSFQCFDIPDTFDGFKFKSFFLLNLQSSSELGNASSSA